MKCPRCAAHMLPSQEFCDTCRPFDDEALLHIRNERGGQMRWNRLAGYSAVAGSCVAIAFTVLGITGSPLGTLFWFGIASALGGFGARRIERTRLAFHLKFFHHLTRQSLLKRGGSDRAPT